MSMNLPRIRVRVLWAVFACVYFFSSTLDGWSRLLPGTAGCPAHSGSPFFIIFAAAACFFRKKYLLPASLGLMLILLIQFLLRAPSNDRDWNPSCARPPYAEFLTHDQVRIHDIRDFRYRTETGFRHPLSGSGI